MSNSISTCFSLIFTEIVIRGVCYVDKVNKGYSCSALPSISDTCLTLLAGTFKFLRNLITPHMLGDKLYEELVKVLMDNFSPNNQQRLKFYSRSRKPGENVSSYVAELHALVDHCSFDNSLDTVICDRIVCGDSIQKRLLTEGDKLTLAKVITIAQSYETAQKDATEFLPNETAPQPVHRVQPAVATQVHNKKCYRCARPGHLPSACRFKKECCHKCNKIDHIKRACTTVNPRSIVFEVQSLTGMLPTLGHCQSPCSSNLLMN